MLGPLPHDLLSVVLALELPESAVPGPGRVGTLAVHAVGSLFASLWGVPFCGMASASASSTSGLGPATRSLGVVGVPALAAQNRCRDPWLNSHDQVPAVDDLREDVAGEVEPDRGVGVPGVAGSEALHSDDALVSELREELSVGEADQTVGLYDPLDRVQTVGQKGLAGGPRELGQGEQSGGLVPVEGLDHQSTRADGSGALDLAAHADEFAADRERVRCAESPLLLSYDHESGTFRGGGGGEGCRGIGGFRRGLGRHAVKLLSGSKSVIGVIQV